MKLFRNFTLVSVFFLSIFFLFSPIASAHEVYVLNPTQINEAMHTSPFSMMDTVMDNLHQFMFWAFLGFLIVIIIFFVSIFRILEKWLHPFFVKMRPYAPFVARVTIGLSFLAAAYFQASYGPEFSLVDIYGSFEPVAIALLTLIGISAIVGYYIRVAAFIALIMYGIAVWFNGWYMLMYVNYLGEIMVLLILGSHSLSFDTYLAKKYPSRKSVSEKWKKFYDYFAPKSFAILRICFGISLIVASLYAKVFHNMLGLETVEKYHLDTLLGFEAHFLVLGAALVEISIGLFFVLGFEMRFAALFFEFWLVQSLFFFGEAVWPHIILIGIPIALVMYGYDSTSLEGYFRRKKKYEPVL